MGVDLHKKVGDYGQNINRMPIWGIRTVVIKNLHETNTMVIQYLNEYRTFTSNTDWNMTHNQTTVKVHTCRSSIGGKIMQKFMGKTENTDLQSRNGK